MKSNRDLIEEELAVDLASLRVLQDEIRSDDAALRVKRDVLDAAWLSARNKRMAVFALDGDTSKTVDDADAANAAQLDGGV